MEKKMHSLKLSITSHWRAHSVTVLTVLSYFSIFLQVEGVGHKHKNEHTSFYPGSELVPRSLILSKLKSLPMWLNREGNGNPLQYSWLENPMGGGAWWAAVHGVAKSWTRLSNFTFTFHFHALEKETATHSSVLAWRIPGMGEPGGLPSVASHRAGHDWSDLAAAACDWKILI